jgi:hypothetical protein
MSHLTPAPNLMRRGVLAGGASLVLGGCFDTPCYERNAVQKAFLDGLQALARPALASSNPLRIEEAAKQSMALGDKVGAFADWCGTVKTIEGNAETVAVTIEVGPQVSLYAFNDWKLAMAGSVADLFSTRSRESPPPGLSDGAIAALKTFRLDERVAVAGRMGDIAGSGLFDLSRLFGKGEAENRQFLQSPRFVARIEQLAARKN